MPILTKFSIEQSDRVTAVSAFLRDETYRAFGCAGCDVIVIPNFIATAEYHPPGEGTCRRSLAPPDHKVLVHVSNFRPVKRVTDVVRVFAGVRRELPATLVLVGDGPERDAAEQEVDHLELRRDVRFLGKVDNVAEILRGSDLFLLPSETESFGLAALEAMACAVPVIATAVGGLPEVVVPGETGFLTPKGDVAAMIAHGLRVLRDGALHARMRAAAADIVNGTAVLVGLAAFAVLGLYSPVLKRRGLPGNVAVALLGGLPLIYGALAVGHAAAGIVPWILATWIHLVREIVKDIDDQTGDQTLGRRTLPLVLGARPASLVAAGLAAAFVPLSLALPAAAHYRSAYFLIALFAQLVVLAVASRLFTGRTQGNSRLLKGAMLVGIVALVAGRVA